MNLQQGAMMQHHEREARGPGSFNEVIIDPTGWKRDATEPPDVIEAIYFIRDPAAEHTAGRRELAFSEPREVG